MGGPTCSTCNDVEADAWFKRWNATNGLLTQAVQGLLTYKRDGGRMVCTLSLARPDDLGSLPAWAREALKDKQVADACREIRL